MAEYVVGFALSVSNKKVLLVRKNRPDFQKGKLNGVGGKKEENETPLEAMIREFKEETGLEETDWIHYCSLSIPKAQSHYEEDTLVHFFTVVTNRIWLAVPQTDEGLELADVDNLPRDCMNNIKWLIPMLRYDSYFYSVTEEHKVQ